MSITSAQSTEVPGPLALTLPDTSSGWSRDDWRGRHPDFMVSWHQVGDVLHTVLGKQQQQAIKLTSCGLRPPPTCCKNKLT